MSNQRNTKTPALSHEQAMDLMAAWKEPPFLTLPWHETLRLRMSQALRGESSFAVVGAPGTGKSEAVRRTIRRIERELWEAASGGSALEVRSSPVLLYTGSKAEGSKTSLINLLEMARGGLTMTTSEIRRHSPSSLLTAIVSELREREIRLVCTDEAQMMNETNLDLLRQVVDRGRDEGHPVCLGLIGTPDLMRNLERIQQAGQRVAWDIRAHPLSLADFREFLPGFHPLLPSVMEEVGTKKWTPLIARLHMHTLGKFRRIKDMLQGANAVALKLNQPLDAEILEGSATDLARE